MAWGQLAGAAAGIGAGLSASHQEKKSFRNVRRRGKTILGARKASTDRLMDLSEMYKKKGVGEVSKGFQEARGELSRGTGAAKRQAKEAGQKTSANISQSLTSSGLGQTTAGANMQRMAANDTSRQLADIDAQMASMYADLAARKGTATGAAMDALAGFYGNRAQMETGYYKDVMALWGGPVTAQKTFDFSGLGTAIDGLFSGGGSSANAAALQSMASNPSYVSSITGSNVPTAGLNNLF